MRFRNQRRGSPQIDLSDATSVDGGAISSRKKKGQLTTGGRILLGLFFSVFLMAGVGATYAMAVKPWLNVIAARSWTPVTCHILSSEVDEHSDSDSTTYSVTVTYTYKVNGRAYEGNQYDFTEGSSSGRKSKREIVKRYREGLQTTCFVNPENPAESVIERGVVRDWAFGLIPLVFVVIGGGGVFFAIFGQRKTPGSEASSGRALRAQQANWSRPTTVADDFSGGAADRSGSVELKPGSTRVGKLVAVIFFALFWNGIVSVFVVNLVGDIARGGVFEWVFALFLLPFVGVGVFLIGLIARFTMELSNPVPHLTVNRRAFAPGETLDLTWRFEGRAKRLKSVRFWLEGREEATYRRGTDTKTDKEVFATLEIAAVSGLATAEAGHAALRLPGSVMHSFKSTHNRVVWELRVKGEIERWPDLSEEFPLEIVPGTAHAVSNQSIET